MRTTKLKNYDDLPLTLTAPEVGEVLGISRAAAYELVRSEGFPSMRIGTRILVPKDKLIAWINEQVEVNLLESIKHPPVTSFVCPTMSLTLG